jgi:hypothetical protein
MHHGLADAGRASQCNRAEKAECAEYAEKKFQASQCGAFFHDLTNDTSTSILLTATRFSISLKIYSALSAFSASSA